MSQSIDFSLYITSRFLIALLLAVTLSGCGVGLSQEADFNASEGRCYSMTPLLQTLPQSSQLGRLVETERGCTIDRVWVTYAEDDSPDSPYFYISTIVLDGESPFVRDFTLDGTADISGPTVPKVAITSSGESAIKSLESCQKQGVELGSARPMQDIHILTEVAGQSVCILTHTFNGKLTGTLSLLPRPDLMMDIRYFRQSDGQPYDADDIAELMLPLVFELTIPDQNWPGPADSH
ncbi:hypothetical protein ACFOZ5_01610 [Marinobacter lacisalsi]|uniref:Lipoprotein n=1 Tax=Marinobacter lacisalsi TaxID=475979 RepID=A0ABV8QBK9_9GAMM